MKSYRAKAGIGHVGHSKVDPGFRKPTRPKNPQAPKKSKLPYLDDNFDPLSPRTGKQAKRYINSAVRLETNPLKRQLGAEYRASSDRENRILPAWFQGYKDDVARWRGESQAASNAAVDRVAEFSNQGGVQDAANRAAMEQRAMQDAQMRGVAYDPSAFQGQANAEAARHNLQTSVLGTLAGQGANQFAYLTNRLGIAGQEELAQRQNQNLRTQKIRSDQRELARSQGDLARKLMDEMTESERKYLLEKGSLKLDNKKLKQDYLLESMKEQGRNQRNNANIQADSIQNLKDRIAKKRRQSDDQAADALQAKLDRKLKKKLAKKN